MLTIAIIAVCIYLAVRVSQLQSQINKQQKVIDELLERTNNSDLMPLAEDDKRARDENWYEGAYVGPELKATLRELKKKGNVDAAVYEFCKATGLPENYARDYIAML